VVSEPVLSIDQLGQEGTPNEIRLIEQIAPHYAQAGGVENALRLARAALKDTSDAEYRTYFPVFDPRGYKAIQTLIPVERMYKKLSGEFLPDGYTSKIIRNRRSSTMSLMATSFSSQITSQAGRFRRLWGTKGRMVPSCGRS
jgi:hypothetical protein